MKEFNPVVVTVLPSKQLATTSELVDDIAKIIFSEKYSHLSNIDIAGVFAVLKHHHCNNALAELNCTCD